MSGGESISKRIMGRVRPDEPLRNKVEVAQKNLGAQISKLEAYGERLQKKHDTIFERVVASQKGNRHGEAQMYAGELAHIRKVKGIVGGAKLSFEQIKLRLDTVSDLGDVVVTLSPCMSVIKGLAPSLGEIMPGASASMQDLSQMLGDVMSGSQVTAETGLAPGGGTSADTLAIMEEAQSVVAGQVRNSIPDVPEELKRQILEKRSDVFL